MGCGVTERGVCGGSGTGAGPAAPRQTRDAWKAAALLDGRWWGVLGEAVQHAVARAVLHGRGGDLDAGVVERPPGVADLPA